LYPEKFKSAIFNKLSSAFTVFDAVDHNILIPRLRTSYGLSGMVLHWFQSYLAGRRQYVRTASSASSPMLILSGVLLRHIARAAEHPPVCFQIRVPVTSSIACSVTAGPWQCHSFLNPAVFAEAAPVGDELGCPTGVFFVEVRPHHSAPLSVALAQRCAVN